jgi:MFS family permease
VLFAQDELGLGSVGYGLLLTGHGVGGVIGALVAARLGRRAGTAALLVAAVLVRAGTQLGLGVVANAWLGGALLAAAGVTGAVFSVVGVSLRQAVVPDHLMGRVVSAFRTLAYGAVPLGAVLGGVVGRIFGVRAPFLVGAVVLAATGLLALPVVNAGTVRAARIAAGPARPGNDA